MISSTARDLPLYREAVRDACLKAGFMPIMMEHLAAQDRSAFDVSVGMVEDAEVYLGVFAHAYGSSPDGDERSYTEIEFDKAVQLGIPVVAFLAHLEHPRSLSLVDKGRKAAKLKRLKSRAKKSRIVREFTTPESLREAVIHALADLKKDAKEITPPASPPRYVPRQLPGPVPDFNDAQKALLEVASLLTSRKTATIAAVKGMGGVGKTSLAIEVGHYFKDRCHDGVVFVDLRGWGAEPMAPDDVLTHVIRSFEPNTPAARNRDELLAQYRQVVADREALIVLDNARDVAQIRDVVKLSPPTMVLVTSRQALAVDGLETVELDHWTLTQSVEWIRGLIPANRAEDHELRSIAKLCGGLPLALRAAERFLHLHPAYGVRDYTAALLDRSQKLGKEGKVVETVLGYSVEQLSLQHPELAHRWRLLCVFPADFDAAAAAAVWETTESAARADLTTLEDNSLVIVDPADGRYRLHDLMRIVAREQAVAAGEEAGSAKPLLEAERRFAAYFNQLFSRANEMFISGGAAQAEALQLYDLEQANILHGNQLGSAHRHDDTVSLELAAGYIQGGINIANIRLHPRRLVDWLDQSVKDCQKLGHRAGEGRACGNLGVMYCNLGEYPKALRCHRRHLKISRELGNRAGESCTWGNLGLVYGSLGEYPKAKRCHRRTLRIAQELRDRAGEGRAWSGLGIVFNSLGEYPKAMRCHRRDVRIARELGDRAGEGRAWGNLGLVYHRLGEYPKARRCHRRHLRIARELGDRAGERSALWNLGDTLWKQATYRERALRLMERSLKITESLGLPELEMQRATIAKRRAELEGGK